MRGHRQHGWKRSLKILEPAGGQQKSRLSLGGDTVIAAAAAQATAVAVQPPVRDSARRRQKMRHLLPYEQRMDLPGKTELGLPQCHMFPALPILSAEGF